MEEAAGSAGRERPEGKQREARDMEDEGRGHGGPVGVAQRVGTMPTTEETPNTQASRANTSGSVISHLGASMAGACRECQQWKERWRPQGHSLGFHSPRSLFQPPLFSVPPTCDSDRHRALYTTTPEMVNQIPGAQRVRWSPSPGKGGSTPPGTDIPLGWVSPSCLTPCS